MQESPIVAQIKEQIDELKSFHQYISMHGSKSVKSVRLDFQHKKFTDSRGFALLEPKTLRSADFLKDVIIDALEKEIIKLNSRL